MITSAELENYAKQFLELSPDMFCVLDADYNLTFANQYMEDAIISRLTNKGLEESKINFFQLIHKDDQELAQSVFEYIKNTNKTSQLECKFDLGENTIFNLVKLRKSAEKEQYYVYLKDITMSMKFEEKIKSKNTRLEKSNDELREFAYIVSHDLKAPLRGISTLANWILEDYAEDMDDEFKENMNLLIQRAKNADELINAILSFSRSVNKIDSISTVNLKEVVSEIVKSLHKPENIEVKIEGELPSIRTARAQIYQVFQNLMSNAFKYASSQVTVKAEDLEDNYRFSIIDDGPGIDSKFHEKIFQIFQTAGDKKKGSTGVGLSIVKKILEMFSGSIDVESDGSNGCAFIFTLPKETRI